MRLLIGFGLYVGAVLWFGGRLEAAGVGPQGFAAIFLLGGVGTFVALIVKLNRDGPEQDAPAAASAAVSTPARRGPAPVVLAEGLSQPLLMRYNDGRGVETKRSVVVLEAFGTSPSGAITHLRGFCQLRRGIRTFRRERIAVAADPDTGDVVEDLDLHLLGRPAVPPYEPPVPEPKKRRRAAQKAAPRR